VYPIADADAWPLAGPRVDLSVVPDQLLRFDDAIDMRLVDLDDDA
jgi:hypothetical protein